tara:strand:+ start:639 stop:818 length:180 start_codon:yes stop_codon:yes gene_type:complete
MFFYTAALQELLPEIIHQIGPDAIPNLKRLAEGMQAARPQNDADDDIPPLVDAEEAASS